MFLLFTKEAYGDVFYDFLLLACVCAQNGLASLRGFFNNGLTQRRLKYIPNLEFCKLCMKEIKRLVML